MWCITSAAQLLHIRIIEYIMEQQLTKSPDVESTACQKVDILLSLQRLIIKDRIWACLIWFYSLFYILAETPCSVKQFHCVDLKMLFKSTTMLAVFAKMYLPLFHVDKATSFRWLVGLWCSLHQVEVDRSSTIWGDKTNFSHYGPHHNGSNLCS